MRQSNAQVKSGTQEPKLLDRVGDKIRLKHYSIRTEQAYTDWIKRYVLFHGKRHPQEMSAAEVERFLTDWVVKGQVYTHVLNKGGHGVTSPLDM